MSTQSVLPFQIISYQEVSPDWPGSGNHIMYSSITDSTIVLYQITRQSVAQFASNWQSFKNQTHLVRWKLRPTFLSSLYASGWCTKPDQEHVLALTVPKEAFENLLQKSLTFTGKPNAPIKLEWEPDHYPSGENAGRFALSIRIKGDSLDNFLKSVIKIKDVTSYIRMQRRFLLEGKFDHILVPDEKVYELNQNLAHKIGVDKVFEMKLPSPSIHKQELALAFQYPGPEPEPVVARKTFDFDSMPLPTTIKKMSYSTPQYNNNYRKLPPASLDGVISSSFEDELQNQIRRQLELIMNENEYDNYYEKARRNDEIEFNNNETTCDESEEEDEDECEDEEENNYQEAEEEETERKVEKNNENSDDKILEERQKSSERRQSLCLIQNEEIINNVIVISEETSNGDDNNKIEKEMILEN